MPSARGMVDRIGGPERLRVILADFYARMARDPMLGFFFSGRDLERIVAGQHAFLLRALGATDRFDGRHPGVAHRGLPPILRGHFDRRLQILSETLADHGVAEADARRWRRLEESFRGVVQQR